MSFLCSAAGFGLSGKEKQAKIGKSDPSHSPESYLVAIFLFLQWNDKTWCLFLQEIEALNTVVMNWIYLTLVFLRNVVYNDFFLFWKCVEINGNHNVTTRSKWLPLQEKTTSFFSSPYLKRCSLKIFSLFFFKPGQAALIDVFVPVWKSDLTSRKSLVCVVHLSLQYQPQFWAVSSEFWSRINRWTSLFESHRALFLSIKPKVAALLVLKCSRVVNSLSYSLTVFIVCARAEANVPL